MNQHIQKEIEEDLLLSTSAEVKRVKFPKFTELRVMMMPFRLDQPFPLEHYRDFVASMVASLDASVVAHPVAYMTIDEGVIPAGETQRVPGLHVDGVEGHGGGGGWGAGGFLMAASCDGALAYEGVFRGKPGEDGDCEHLRKQLSALRPGPKKLLDSALYYCSPMMLHEASPVTRTGPRQFARLSLPNNCPWFEGYTPSPVGVLPTGPIRPRRVRMDYRP